MIDQWPGHVETMRSDGLHISLPDEELHVRPDAQHICDLCALNRWFDVVLICFKAYDTRWAAELIKSYLIGSMNENVKPSAHIADTSSSFSSNRPHRQ